MTSGDFVRGRNGRRARRGAFAPSFADSIRRGHRRCAEINQNTGGKELTNGDESYPLTQDEEADLKTGTKAKMLEIIEGKANATAVSDDELHGIRSALGGVQLQPAKPVKRVDPDEGQDE